MNILGKMVAAGLCPKGSAKYVEQGEISVEINHILSVSQRTSYGERTTEFNYQKYPLKIVRPTDGKTVIKHNCQICNSPLEIEARSKNALVKIIKPTAITFFVSIFGSIILGMILGNRPLNQSILGVLVILLFTLILLSAAVLFFTLPMEYQNMGISEVIDSNIMGGNDLGYAKHGINRRPTE